MGVVTGLTRMGVTIVGMAGMDMTRRGILGVVGMGVARIELS